MNSVLLGMVLMPVSCDVDPATDPDLIMLLDIVQEALQRGSAPGTAHEAAMQPDRHHLTAFGIERIEAILEISKILLARIKALQAGKAHVVDIERIGND